MSHLIPFVVLQKTLNMVSAKGSTKVQLTYEEFQTLVRTTIRATPVDEEWYRKTYPDVAEAIAAGLFRSAKQHFIENGYFEGRWPFKPKVDAQWYIATYPDVAEGLARGNILSAEEHFVHHGYAEGRLPSED